MASHPIFFVGNLNPSITETIRNDDGSAHDLSGQTVTFSMRLAGSSTPKVNAAAATVVNAAAGTVRYDWIANDVNAEGLYLVWWTVTTTAGGKTQDLAEAIIEFRDHQLGSLPSYVELEEFKSSLEMTGYTFADTDMLVALSAASRAVDDMTKRRFYLDPDANQVRTYTPDGLRLLMIDDLSVLTSVLVDRTGSGSWTETWVLNTDFILAPFNAAADSRPYEMIQVRPLSGRWFPTYIPRSVQVTGQFGWAVLPQNVRLATTIIAAKLLKRVREAPFGIVTVGIDQGAAMRIAKTDPDVWNLLHRLDRSQPFG